MILVVFDDTGKKSEVISDIIGEKGFGDVVVKKRRLEDYFKDAVNRLYPDAVFKKLSTMSEYPDFVKELEMRNYDEIKVLHWFSDFIVSDEEKVLLTIQKLSFVEENYGILSGKRSVAAVFPNLNNYILFCKNVINGQKAWDMARNSEETFEIEGVTDIGEIGNFIQCVAGNFDARYFNSLKGDRYTLVKSSTNKDKIKAEYTFYHLLPDDMKYWFVIPFNYTETDTEASYTMERLNMTDLSIKWVHGSMDESEFRELLDRYFYFFAGRHATKCSEEEYKALSDRLYVDKVRKRIAEAKEQPAFKKILRLLEANDCGIDSLLDRYLELKGKIEALKTVPFEKAIGHGDPCFSNAMYNKSTKTLKFIDPKGAMKEEELWTDPYYDVAKLSHSICGLYDFFNNALFDIKVDSGLAFDLEVPFDNEKYKEIFREILEKNGYDYLRVRIYEVSLFLSMLPLHADNPHKVLGFVLNAKKIMEEIAADV